MAKYMRGISMALPTHKTKIVATIGPASESMEVMEEMIRAGMNIARLNFSHGDFDGHTRVIERLRRAAKRTGRRVAILADLPGPKIRIGSFAKEPIHLKSGDAFTLTTKETTGDEGRVSVTFERLPKAVRPGDTVFLNDGFIQLEVMKIEGKDVRCRVLVGGDLRSRKGLNLPGIDLGISAFTEHDLKGLQFASEHGVDAVSQSFVQSGADIDAVRRAAAKLRYQPFIIAKIERSRALDRIEEIIEAADGIMIARGDLGVEIPIEGIAVVQKRLMRLANRRAKPVITATQMLESMTENRRPTRAEATDVANAILDGTDCVMLSAESAMGRFPVDAVAMLGKIAASAEAHRCPIPVKELYEGVDLSGKIRPEHLIAIGVEACLQYASPSAVFVPTHSGATARSITRFRFPVWTVGISSQEWVCQQLQFSSGIFPVHEQEHPEDWRGYTERWLKKHGMSPKLAVLTEGPSRKHPEGNHRMEIIDFGRKSR
jgi:pyruvate kinase